MSSAEVVPDPAAPAAPPALGRIEPQLSLGIAITYGLPTVGVGFMFLLVNLYMMKFATDVLLMSPAVMGAIFMVSRLWDAVSDPLAGYFSDRTSLRFGRRIPWILASIPLIAGAFWMMWSPPASLDSTWLLIWMGVGVIGFYSAMTIFIVPHQALGAELTLNYHDRSRVFGVRHVSWTLGSLLALVGMALLIGASGEGGIGARPMALRIAVVASIATAALILLAGLRLRERPEFRGRGSASPLSAFTDVWKNTHARLLLVVFLIENTGGATIGILTPYIAQYIVGTPEQTPLYILCYMIPSFASVPLWVPLSRRFGKKSLWIFSMILTGIAFGGMFFLEEGSSVLIMVLAVLAGLAGGCGATVGPSVQADVIDFDELQTGERKEGAYFAAWNFVFKAATGITIGLTGVMLQYSGFVPNQEQTETTKLAMLGLYSVFPLVCYAAGTLIFLRFGLNETEHAEVRRQLDARASAERAAARTD